MVEPMNSPSQRGIVRLGGAAAISGGAYSLLIATIYAVTRVGAAGDRLFGSLDALLFPAPALFTLALVTFRVQYGKHVPGIGRQALAGAIFGMALVTIGQFGYAVGFARSGNYWIRPGSLCVQLGLLVFAVSAARGHTLPRRAWVLPFLMAVLPVLMIAASQVVALVRAYIALGQAKADSERHWRPYSGEPGVNHLAYEVDDVESLRARLKAAGYRDSTPPNAHPHRKRVYFYDPEGNDWEFVQYFSQDPAERNDYELPDS